MCMPPSAGARPPPPTPSRQPPTRTMQLALAALAPSQAAGLRMEPRRASSQQRGGRAAALVVRATGSSLDGSKGLFSSNSSLLGPKAPGQGSGPSLGSPLSSSKPQVSLDDVPLASGVSAPPCRRRPLPLPWLPACAPASRPPASRRPTCHAARRHAH